MPYYRLYLLNLHTGHIDGAENFHIADDVEAICLVNQRKDEVPTELWCGGRKVARFRPVHDRMPVLLHVEDYDHWLRGSPEDVIAFQERCFPDELTAMERTTDPWFRRRAPMG